MSAFHKAIIAGALCAQALAAPPVQIPLQHDWAETSIDATDDQVERRRPLHGRFLHITDFHPDYFYQTYSSTSEDAACHRGTGPAGIYGAEVSDCDSPILLINKTMDWVAHQFKDNIDFVLWTGDSARHDNDEDHPRDPEQVISLNKLVLAKMTDAFGKHNGDEEDDDPNNDFIIPIVPNIGNNDILPHNILSKGPNFWTRTYSSVWRQFIPEVQKHQFEQGGWFYVEVIPNKLAVFSLNTMYFYSKNAAVDGCAVHSEPGYQQMEWLRIHLQFMRQRGMKAILIGHVPPVRQDAKTTWDETCWQKYTLWNKQYRDVVLTSIYGHFNYDHFMLQDFKQIDQDTKDGRMAYSHPNSESGDDVSTQLSSSYWMQLRDEWAELPEPPKPLSWLDWVMGDKKKQEKKERKYRKRMGGEFAERFSTSFVSASVVPNLFPTLRIFEYNTTGLEGHHNKDLAPTPPPPDFQFSVADDVESSKKKKKEKKYKFTIPDPPSKSSPPGPAYSPQSLSLIKYIQYFANITYINNDFTSADADDGGDDVSAAKWNEGKHKGKKPHDKNHEPKPRKFKFEQLYDTQDDDVYQLKDLTMPSLVDLARRIGNFVPEDSDALAAPCMEAEKSNKHKKNKKKKKHHKGKKHHHKENEAWYTFVSRAFVYTMDPQQVEEEFGH